MADDLPAGNDGWHRLGWHRKLDGGDMIKPEVICPMVVALMYGITSVSHLIKGDPANGVMWICWAGGNAAMVWVCCSK